MKLSTLSILLGAGMALPQIYALANPKGFTASARAFPRSIMWGYLLMALATGWFLYNVNAEDIADFASIKRMLMFAFGAIGIGTCLYVTDFLAIRGLAVLMLLLSKTIVDTARWHESDWRLVLITWAYVMVFMGIWLTISPWRARDFIQWGTATESRLKILSGVRLAFAALLVVLGFVVFK
ncbi:MAG: hypothetical protein K0Q55_3147 [Verrucomicrobia bacterium]|jgi:hypothetical protein|nr:hypothetical protein [Verrucomicrobiota bacterium]